MYRLSTLLSNNNCIPVNRILIKSLGLLEAVMFGELCGESDYWHNNNGVDADGYFFTTYQNIEEKLGLKRKMQEKCISNLKNIGVIDTKLKGNPRKRYVKINEETLEDLINGIVPTVQSSSYPEDEQKRTESTNKDTIYKDTIKRVRKTFNPPTLEEVKAYCKERNSSVDANKFFEYYEAGDWIDAKGNKVKNWKQKLITWENRNKKETKKEVVGGQDWIMTPEEEEAERIRENAFWKDYYTRAGMLNAARLYS